MDWIKRYWIEASFGVIISCLGLCYKRLSKKIKDGEALKMGVQALLRDRIVQAYNYYHNKRYCPIYAKENISALYEQYHALGGNGTITGLYNSLMALPTERDEDGST